MTNARIRSLRLNTTGRISSTSMIVMVKRKRLRIILSCSISHSNISVRTTTMQIRMTMITMMIMTMTKNPTIVKPSTLPMSIQKSFQTGRRKRRRHLLTSIFIKAFKTAFTNSSKINHLIRISRLIIQDQRTKKIKKM